MVVLQSHVPCFQGLPGSPQWVGLTSGSGGHDRWFHLREYNCGELSGRLGKRDQRLEQFQEISHQGGHVPIWLHHVRQDFDRIEKSHKTFRITHPMLPQHFYVTCVSWISKKDCILIVAIHSSAVLA